MEKSLQGITWGASLALVLAACGGTAEPPASAPAPANPSFAPTTQVTPDNGIRVIEYYGDSTVWGFRTSVGDRVATPAPAAFAEALPNPAAYEVRNEGVTGSTACQLLNGTDGVHPPWTVQMATSRAKYVFVNFAINDEWRYDLDAYRSCLHALARTARQYGKQMIFETPNPTRDSQPGRLDLWVDAMRAVADQEKAPVVDQYAYLTAYLDGASPYAICPDGVHPSQAVYVLKGRYAAQAFAALLEKDSAGQ